MYICMYIVYINEKNLIFVFFGSNCGIEVLNILEYIYVIIVYLFK